MNQAIFKILNRTNHDSWSFPNKERAKAFLNFVIKDFISNKEEPIENLKYLYSSDFIVQELVEDKVINKWPGSNFLGIVSEA